MGRAVPPPPHGWRQLSADAVEDCLRRAAANWNLETSIATLASGAAVLRVPGIAQTSTGFVIDDMIEAYGSEEWLARRAVGRQAVATAIQECGVGQVLMLAPTNEIDPEDFDAPQIKEDAYIGWAVDLPLLDDWLPAATAQAETCVLWLPHSLAWIVEWEREFDGGFWAMGEDLLVSLDRCWPDYERAGDRGVTHDLVGPVIAALGGWGGVLGYDDGLGSLLDSGVRVDTGSPYEGLSLSGVVEVAAWARRHSLFSGEPQSPGGAPNIYIPQIETLDRQTAILHERYVATWRRGQPTGSVWLAEFRDGLLWRFRWFGDREQALSSRA